MADPTNPDDSYQMQLLEPLSWVGLNNAQAGGFVNLSLPELGISGPAQVLSIDACPSIETGNGRVVLGTFQHVSNDMVDVILAGESQPLQVTSGHKLWSLDRDGWVQAGDLQAGERLAGENGPVTVQSVARDPQSMEAYNLDVETDHRYEVTDLGVLVHNVSSCAGFRADRPLSAAELLSRDVSGACKADAAAILKDLNTKGLDGEILQIQGASGERNIGTIKCPGGGTIVDDWGFHQYVRVGDTVYDNLTGPAGMPFDEYVQLFRDSARLTFTATPR